MVESMTDATREMKMKSFRSLEVGDNTFGGLREFIVAFNILLQLTLLLVSFY